MWSVDVIINNKPVTFKLIQELVVTVYRIMSLRNLTYRILLVKMKYC